MEPEAAPQQHDPLVDGLGRLQGLAKGIAGPLLRGYFRMEVEGEEHVPAEGAFVLISNHESMWDVPLLVVACPRPIVFMGKNDVFDNPLKRWAFTRLGGFPIGVEGKDPAALRNAQRVLATGRVLGLYPEGTRVRAGELGEFRTGAARIALAAGVPIVPGAMHGAAEIWRKVGPLPAIVRVAFGEPVAVERVAHPEERRTRARDLTEELRARMGTLLAGLRRR